MILKEAPNLVLAKAVLVVLPHVKLVCLYLNLSPS